MSKLVDQLRKLLGEDIDDDTDKELKRFGKIIERNGGSGGKTTDTESFDEDYLDADGGVELFAEATTDSFQVDPETGYFWAPAIRSGQWAVRPGPGGKKVRRPLKVIAGRSKSPRKEIGLQDIKDAFDDGAIEHVTVPTSHNNSVLENTGFVRALKIVDGTDSKGNPCKVLMAAYDFTEDDVKGKVERGTIPNRSCGLLYDYVNTETGKKYKVALEHIALTAKPWITGLKAFGKKLRDKLSDDVEFEALVLSEEEELDIDEELEPFAEVIWDDTDSYQFRRDGVQREIDRLRDETCKDGMAKPPYFYVEDVSSDKALITEGYGRNSRKWVAKFKIEDGDVTLDPATSWKRVREQLVTDDEGEKEDEERESKLPASYEPGDAVEPIPQTARDRLALAQAERLRGDNNLSELRRRQAELLGDPQASSEDARTLVNAFRLINVQPAPGLLKKAGQLPLSQEDPTHPKGGERVKDEKNKGGSPPESDDPRVAELQAQLDQERSRNERLSTTVERLSGTVNQNQTKEYLSELTGGLPALKEHPGVLKEIERAMLADDGGPAVVVNLSDDGEDETELSVTDVVKRIFGAFEKDEQGRVKLSQVATEIAEEEGEEGKNGRKTGKPAKEETETELSARERVDKALEEDPELAAELESVGITSSSSSDKGKKPAAVAAGGGADVDFADDADEGGDD